MWTAAAACARSARRTDLMVAVWVLILLFTATVSVWFEFAARHRAYMLPIILAWAATLAERPDAIEPHT